MSTAIVRSQTPEEIEYTRYLGQVEERKRRAAELQADVESLKLSLGRFNAEYHARIGTLFVELDRLRLSIDEYEARIARLQTYPHADPTEVECDIAAQFAARREEVDAEDEETRRYERIFGREKQRPTVDADNAGELKRLYRDLAKRFHADLSRTDEERLRRQAVMQRINAGFNDRAFALLSAIAQEVEFDDPSFEARSVGEKLVWAIREVSRLVDLIAELDTELAAQRATDTHAMWQRQEGGERLLETLEDDLQADVVAARSKLAALASDFGRLCAAPKDPISTSGHPLRASDV